MVGFATIRERCACKRHLSPSGGSPKLASPPRCVDVLRALPWPYYAQRACVWVSTHTTTSDNDA